MLAIGFGIAWLGYAVGYYGWNRITGGNDSFKSLFWPGDYKPTTRDGASSPTAPVKPVAATGSAPGASSPTVGMGQNPSGPGYSATGAGGAIHP